LVISETALLRGDAVTWVTPLAITARWGAAPMRLAAMVPAVWKCSA
jgi:hypothetical protein